MAEIKNLKKAADRILKAVKKKERVILYGDSDMDGVSAVLIAKEALKNLGLEPSAIYFPDRETEGYGISKIALKSLKKIAPALLVTFDCGISNFKEVKLAKKNGFEVIIIDHHEVLEKLPEAKIIVDPKQKGDKYPFKGLAGTGLSFRLAQLLLKEKMTESLRKNFLELVALATLADMMPQKEENRDYTLEGLDSLKNSWRPGIKVFMKFIGDNLSFDQKVQKLISIMNVRDVENNMPASFRLLTAVSEIEAENLVKKLVEKGENRKLRTTAIFEEAEKRVLEESLPAGRQEENVIFQGDKNWDYALNPIVASLLVQKHGKPTFIYKKLEKESQGTVRAPQGVNSVSLMQKCKKYTITYGGHPQASGFRVKNQNLEKFKACLIKNFKEER